VQILTNLVSNSIEHGFLDKGDNIITINIHYLNDCFIVDYFDNGVGIKEENLHKIFDPFFTTTRKNDSCGLGLSIIYNLANTYFKGTLLSLPCSKGVHFQYEFHSVDL
jgi:signal transduction histidine kinase